jgi:hypothetical protein
MIAKVHKTLDGRKIVTLCDKNLLGKKYLDKNFQLDLTSSFYKGEEKSEQEIAYLIKKAYIVNIVGKESINFCLKLKLIDKRNLLYIKNIPHAQSVLG